MLSGTGGKKRESTGVLSHPEYHDYSNLVAWEDYTGVTKHNTESFPAKLYEMLEQSEEVGHSDIIRWMPHGRAFKIYDRVRFETDVLPCYFSSQTKYGSFHRQINMYGFRRLTTRGNNQDAYYHERFLRGRPILSSLLSWCRTFSSSFRQKCDPTTEPDFVKIPPVESHVQRGMDNRMEPMLVESSPAFNTVAVRSVMGVEQCLRMETGLANQTLLVPGSSSLHESRCPTESKFYKIVRQPETIGQGSVEPIPLSYSLAVMYGSLNDNPTTFGDNKASTLLDPDMVNDVIAIFGTQRASLSSFSL